MNENKELYSIVSPSEALNRGNLFRLYFWPYKYVAGNKTNEWKRWVNAKDSNVCFRSSWLNLYLDIYPNDAQAIGLYNQYSEISNKYLKEYEKKFGNIILNSNESSPWPWINSPWPWERQ